MKSAKRGFPWRKAVRTLISFAVVAAIFGFAVPKFASYSDVWPILAGLSAAQVVWLVLAQFLSRAAYWSVYMAALPGLRFWQSAVAHIPAADPRRCHHLCDLAAQEELA